MPAGNLVESFLLQGYSRCLLTLQMISLLCLNFVFAIISVCFYMCAILSFLIFVIFLIEFSLFIFVICEIGVLFSLI